MVAITPHDLIWVDSLLDAKWLGRCEAWVSECWQPHHPLVVRRDTQTTGWIAAGIRGALRSQRQACWVPVASVGKIVHPENLVNRDRLTSHPQRGLPAFQALNDLLQLSWPMPWGVTGSCGYALATGESVVRDSSDLDLLVRSTNPPPLDWFSQIDPVLAKLPCRIDIQLETPYGGIALSEWRRQSGSVLVKSARGAYLSSNPWQVKE